MGIHAGSGKTPLEEMDSRIRGKDNDMFVMYRGAVHLEQPHPAYVTYIMAIQSKILVARALMVMEQI